MLWKFLPACFALAPHTCQFRHLFSLENTIFKCTALQDQMDCTPMGGQIGLGGSDGVGRFFAE
jgi:hypothetical protein